MKNGNYILIVAPEGWPGATIRDRYCYEHHYSLWRHSGVIPGCGQVVHHKNGNTTDNHPENLEILDENAHRILHGGKKSKVIVRLRCPNPSCSVEFDRAKNKTHLSNKSKMTCCSRRCSGIVSNLIRSCVLTINNIEKENIIAIFQQ